MMTRDTKFSYRGVYINLDRSVSRREHMESQLAAYGLTDRYARFPAVDGRMLPPRGPLKQAELGAFLSHARALEQARGGATALHVLEDDALLSEHVRPVIEDAIAAGLFERFDILFTDTLLNAHLGMLKVLKGVFDKVGIPPRPLRLCDLQVIDLAQENFACLTSYIVGAKSIERILALYRAELENGPAVPVDIFIRDCVRAGRLRAALLFPFVTGFRLEEIAGSTIAAGSPATKPAIMVLAVLRYLFFVGRDLALAKSCLDAATQQNRRETNVHHRMIVQALEFILSADFEEF